jgi:hypothetical protein
MILQLNMVLVGGCVMFSYGICNRVNVNETQRNENRGPLEIVKKMCP